MLQAKIYTDSNTFLMPDRVAKERAFLFRKEAGGAVAILRSAAVHSLVAPEVQVAPVAGTGVPGLTVQRSALGSSGALGWAGTAVWLFVLGTGLVATVQVAVADLGEARR